MNETPNTALVLPEPPQAVPNTDLTQDQAKAFAAFKGVCVRYDLQVIEHCTKCFMDSRKDFCDSEVGPSSVRVRCRCENRTYTAPRGTDLPTKNSTSAFVLGDLTDSSFALENGKTFNVPARLMPVDDSKTIRRMHSVYKALGLEPKIYHRDCWNRSPADGHEMMLIVNPALVLLVCHCRTLYYRGHGAH